MSQQKTLIVDIETRPMLVYVWQLKDQYVGLEQIKEDWQIIAWSAKWLGDPVSKQIYRDLRKQKVLDDKAILGEIRDLLDEADIVISQNGERFDSRKLNTRFITHGFKRPSPYRHFDTWKLAKGVADFTSSSLEYLTAKLNKKYKKLKHKKYPGLELWKQCLAGNTDAWNEMRKYNNHDVLATEELYVNLRAWAPDYFPKVFTFTDASKECGTCGYKGKLIEGKIRTSNKYKYKQHSCPKCGAWSKSERIKE